MKRVLSNMLSLSFIVCIQITNVIAEPFIYNSIGTNPPTTFDCKDTSNLIQHGYFVAFSDSIGSSIDDSPRLAVDNQIVLKQTNKQIDTSAVKQIDDNTLSVSYTVAKLTDTTNWPWIQLNCYLADETPWKDLCGFKITYKADYTLDVKLDQPVLLNYGESYQKELPATTQWSTVVIGLKDFKQPDWSTHKNIPLDLKNIIGLGFAPDVETTKGAKKGTFKIKELTAFGLNINMKDTLNSPIIFYSITDNRIFLSVKNEGKYTIEIFSSNGTLVTSLKDKVLIKGYNDIPMKETIANGIYHIKISNDKTSIKKLGVVGNIPAYFKR